MNLRQRHRTREAYYARPWSGGYHTYDLVKEFAIALGVMVGLAVLLSFVFSSPDRPAVTIQEWATQAPNDFVFTTVTELDGTSGTATYGAPYIDDPTAGQNIGPLPLQRLAGVHEPIDPAVDFVLTPLAASTDPAVLAALHTYDVALGDQRMAWASAYDTALSAVDDGDPAKVAKGDYGPVPAMASGLLAMAQAGALDGLLQEQGGVYQTDYAHSILFIGDGAYLEDQARAEHLGGDQWGMMNETGSYPGQPWLAPYSFWYQIPPFTSSDNADALIWAIMSVFTVVLLLVPFIPGLRELPRRLRVYRIIWRDHYRSAAVAARSVDAPAAVHHE
jgi:hypothetical protein